MSGYICLRDDFKISLSKAGFGNPLAEGSASMAFLNIPGGSSSLPAVGEMLYDYDYYCGGTISSSYPAIRCSRIEQQPYHVENNVDAFKYVCTFESSTEDQASNFRGDTTVISWDSPDKWRLATYINDPTSVGGNIFGSFTAKQSRIVPSGQFSVAKKVVSSNLGVFWADYLDLVGRLNAETVSIIDQDEGGVGIEFSRGQILCAGIELTNRGNDGLYNFAVNFNWRIINNKAINGEPISQDDFNYYLVSETGSTYPAGWAVPVNTSGTNSTALADPPFTYQYANANAFADFISTDYSVNI